MSGPVAAVARGLSNGLSRPGRGMIRGWRLYSGSVKLGIVTLGCDKNSVDTEYLAGNLSARGVSVVAAPRVPARADLDGVLINTCGFIDAAKAESIQTILAWAGHKAERGEAGERFRLFVGGCLTQRYRESLVAELPEVDGFIGVGEFDRVADLLAVPEGAAGPVNLIKELPSVEVRPGQERLAIGPAQAHAFLKIGDGCNHNCTFCAIPGFKGRLRSVPKEILLAEARLLLGRGVRELILVAQDTSDYGKDLYGRDYGIADLIGELGALPGDFWIRLHYFYPGGLTEKFIEAFAGCGKMARYLDMPLQHLHPEMLGRMKRPHNEVNSRERLERLRRAVPGLAVRTTFIVGFPGETDEHFEHLLGGLDEFRFRRVGAFQFSEEEGTPSAAMKPRVAARTRRERYGRLMERQAGISAELNRGLVGSELKVLVESRLDDGRWAGRSEADAPEVDGLVFVSGGEGLRAGDFATVRVTGADVHDLHGVA